jgi:hypothetical protein
MLSAIISKICAIRDLSRAYTIDHVVGADAMPVLLSIASGNNPPVYAPDYAPDFPSLGEFQIA